MNIFIDNIFSNITINTVFTILGGIAGVGTIGSTFILLYKKTKFYWYRQLKKLSPSTSIDFFSSILGIPKITNNFDNLNHLIYINKFFYIGIIANNSGKVLVYSITTRTKSFKPKIYTPIKNKPIVLGKTRFSEINAGGEIFSGAGARRIFYSEKYYVGNPGFYQTFCCSLNEGGYSDNNYKNFIHNLKNPTTTEDLSVKKFRSSTSFNTYSVTSPHHSDDLPYDASPDSDEINFKNLI